MNHFLIRRTLYNSKNEFYSRSVSALYVQRMWREFKSSFISWRMSFCVFTFGIHYFFSFFFLFLFNYSFKWTRSFSGITMAPGFVHFQVNLKKNTKRRDWWHNLFLEQYIYFFVLFRPAILAAAAVKWLRVQNWVVQSNSLRSSFWLRSSHSNHIHFVLSSI